MSAIYAIYQDKHRLLPLQNHTCIVFSPYLLPTSSLSYNKDEVGRR